MILRGSDKHGSRNDGRLAHDTEPMTPGTQPAHAEEWRDPEPPADDPDVFGWNTGDVGAADDAARGDKR